jgi:hypothetical protein
MRRNTALPAVHVGENTYLVNIAVSFSATIDLVICAVSLGGRFWSTGELHGVYFPTDFE